MNILHNTEIYNMFLEIINSTFFLKYFYFFTLLSNLYIICFITNNFVEMSL